MLYGDEVLEAEGASAQGGVIEGTTKMRYANRFWWVLRLDCRVAVLNCLALVTSILTASVLDSTKLRF